jgi:hypothetical protein
MAAVLDRGLGLVIILSVILAVSLVVHRFLGWGPDWSASPGLSAVVLGCVPVVAMVLAWSLTRRHDEVAAARQLDDHCRTKDLFLTRSLIGPACGDYKPLVARQAEERSASVDPRRVVRVEMGPQATYAVAGLAVLFLATVFLPQLDLLGQQAGQQLAAGRKRALKEQKKLAIEKAKVLRKRDVKSKLSKPMQASLRELQKSLQKMQRNQPKRNAKQLNQQQRSLGAQWRRAKSGAGLKSGRGSERQSFGRLGKGKAKEWARGLRRGDDKALKKEMRKLRELLDELAKSKSDLDKQKLAADLADRLQDLKDFAANEARSNDLNDAISRMLQQLQIAQLEGLSPDGLEALKSTLELSELELDQLAQQMRDIQALERVLEALQLAELLNEMEALDAEALAQAENMDPEELARLLRQMLAEKVAKMGTCKECGGGG